LIFLVLFAFLESSEGTSMLLAVQVFVQVSLSILNALQESMSALNEMKFEQVISANSIAFAISNRFDCKILAKECVCLNKIINK
jgi:hypothetical protein